MLTVVRHTPLGTVGVISVEGDLDLAGAPEFRRAMLELLSEGHPHCIVDLTAVDFVDSVGVGLLLGVRRRLVDRGTLVLVAEMTHICRVLDLTGVSIVVPVCSTLEDALAHISSGATDGS